MSTTFPNDKGGGGRWYQIAEYLQNTCHHNVELIASTFVHSEKKQRKEVVSNVNYKLIYQPSYSKNIAIKRLFSLATYSHNIQEYLKKKKPDLIYCSIPDNYTAYKVALFAHENNIPIILDIEDLWPEAMESWLKNRHLSIFKFLLFPYAVTAKKAYALANGYVGTSDEYATIPVRYDMENSKKPKRTVYVSQNISEFDRLADKHKDDVHKNSAEFWVTYAGTIGETYDIKTMVEAAIKLKKQDYPSIVFKILGDGPLRPDLEKYAKANDCNVEFLGYQQYGRMAAYLKASDILVNSFKKTAPQSVVSKVVSYLAAGKPILNTLESKEFKRMIDEKHVGINIPAEDVDMFVNGVVSLYEAPTISEVMGKNARVLAEKDFDTATSYAKISDLICEITSELS